MQVAFWITVTRVIWTQHSWVHWIAEEFFCSILLKTAGEVQYLMIEGEADR